MAYIDLQVSGHGLSKQDSLALSDSYFVIFAPRNRSKRSSLSKLSGDALLRSIVDEMANPLFEDHAHERGLKKSGSLSKGSADGLTVSRSAQVAGHAYNTKRHSRLKDYVELYESEVITRTSNPSWSSARVDFNDLCAGNLDSYVLILCFDWNNQFLSKLIGATKVSTRQLFRCQETVLPLVSFLGARAGSISVTCKLSSCVTLSCGFEIHAFDLPARKFTDSDIYFTVTTGQRISEAPNAFWPAGGHGANIQATPQVKIGAQGHSPIPEQREVYESELNKDSTNPHWKAFSVGFYELCRANDEAELSINLYRRKLMGANRSIGSVAVQVKSLVAKRSQTIPIMKSEVKMGSVYISCKVEEFEMTDLPQSIGSPATGRSSM